MREQMKELCLFMICGQTLLYFQSGKKYERICRMILELLVLAGVIGMILNFLQSLGIRRGEMEATGGAVAGMQRSMEEALSRQLGTEGMEEDFLSGFSGESLIEKYTMIEIKSKYNYIAEQYGFIIEEVEGTGNKLRVLLKKKQDKKDGEETQEDADKKSETDDAGNPAKIVEIEQVAITKIEAGKNREQTTDTETEKESSRITERTLNSFRRQFAFVLATEEDNLEVILID